MLNSTTENKQIEISYLYIPLKSRQKTSLEFKKAGQIKMSKFRESQTSGDSALHTACRIGNLFKIQELISENPSCIEEKDSRLHWTPLFRCVMSGNYQAVSFLLSKGACTDASNDNGERPLHQAVENAQFEIARLLLQNGANPNVQEECGDTPLHIAVNQDDLQIINLLLKHKADPNVPNFSFGRTPLHCAASKHHRKVLKTLLSHGGNPGMYDNHGVTPIMTAKDPDLQELMGNYLQTERTQNKKLGKLFYLLESIGLENYYEVMIRNKYADLDDKTASLSSQALRNIGIKTMAHRYKILLRLRQETSGTRRTRKGKYGCWAKCCEFKDIEEWLEFHRLESLSPVLKEAGYDIDFLFLQMSSEYCFTHDILEEELGLSEFKVRDKLLKQLERDIKESRQLFFRCNSCILF